MMTKQLNSNSGRTDVKSGQPNEAVHGTKNPDWQSDFLTLLPSIRRHAKLRFRYLSPELQEELIQETIARALLDFVRLLETGKGNRIYAGPLARYALFQVCGGRRVGGRLNIRDVSSGYCQHRKDVSLTSLEHFDSSGEWTERLVEDRSSTPADIAAARIDVCEWLKTLPQRSRRLAERLATGESTRAAAEMFGISAARVSQLRRELQDAWQAFQGEPVTSVEL
jgi:hypothetical protein